MDFFNDIFHNLALLEFYFLNIIYILLYIDFILSIFFQHSNILTRASHHWCLASNIVLVLHVPVVHPLWQTHSNSSAVLMGIFKYNIVSILWYHWYIVPCRNYMIRILPIGNIYVYLWHLDARKYSQWTEMFKHDNIVFAKEEYPLILNSTFSFFDAGTIQSHADQAWCQSTYC